LECFVNARDLAGVTTTPALPDKIINCFFLCSLCVERKQIFICTWKTLPGHQLTAYLSADLDPPVFFKALNRQSEEITSIKAE